jgi:hypothetical protein
MDVQMTYRGLTRPRPLNIGHLSLEQRLAANEAFEGCGHGWNAHAPSSNGI